VPQLQLSRDWPNLNKGEILTKQADGRYTHPSGFWIDGNTAESLPLKELIPYPQFTPIVGNTYYYIDDTGVVRSASYQNNATHNARVTYGNYFKTNVLATIIRNRIYQAFQDIIDRGT
jgi:hypothetical protein